MQHEVTQTKDILSINIRTRQNTLKKNLASTH